MRWCHFLAIVAAIIAAVAAAPAPFGEANVVEWPEYFFLQANCTNEPWNKRHIVELPSSKQLGLENFTVSPITPPVKFKPVFVGDGNYAMQGEGMKDDPYRVPFLAALLLPIGTRTISMGIVFLEVNRHRKRYDGFEGCPEGYECIIDKWTFDPVRAYMINQNFRFAGFAGAWEPFKDAGKEGWHVYWKGNAGLHHPIQLDLIPAML